MTGLNNDNIIRFVESFMKEDNRYVGYILRCQKCGHRIFDEASHMKATKVINLRGSLCLTCWGDE